MSLTFIIGGARSGKSTYAELKAKEYGNKVVYIATAVVTDESMAERVKKHKKQRPESWGTIEMYSDFKRLSEIEEFMDSEVVLIDCLTTLIGNYMFDSKINFDTCPPDEVNKLEVKITEELFSLIDVCKANGKRLIMVSNETGLGVVPPYYMGNYFRDISGRINQKITQTSDFMYFVLSGIPVKLKHKGEMIKWQEDF